MTKSKNRVKAEAAKDQRYEFALGPAVSWFLPSSADIWSNSTSSEEKQTSWFIYGAKGSFCYGRISSDNSTNKGRSLVALTDYIEYIKNDSSRVISCQFCKKQTNYPFALALTENGTLILYDCLKKTIILRYTKDEIIHKVSDRSVRAHDNNEQPAGKKLKFSVHISSISWPDLNNAFLSVSMSKEETSFVIWLRIPDSIIHSNMDKSLVEFVRFNTSVSCSDIVCMETLLLEKANMVLIAVGFDDGMINILKLNKDSGSAEEIIVLKKHVKPICSLSLWSPNSEKHEYSSGILASVSRSGLVLLWDIDNEFCFADYDVNMKAEKCNWFASSFYFFKDWQVPHLVVSNMSGALVDLEIPRKIRPPKKRLNGKNLHGMEGPIKHRSLIFNVIFDLNSGIMMTTSLDNNLIFWDCAQTDEISNNNKKAPNRVEPCYLLPTMANNSRTHKMRFSPIANDNLVAALGEAGLCFHRVTSERKDFRFHMTRGCSYVCKEIKKQRLTPTTVAWQPNHEYRLAIGTREGVVLRLDISNNGAVIQSPFKQMKSVKDSGDSMDFECDAQSSDNDQYNVGTKTECPGVYSLCWGPNPLDRNKTAIYCVTSHKVTIYTTDDEKPKEFLTDLVSTIPEKFSNIDEFFSMAAEVSWKSDFDLMALGTTDGRVLIIQLKENVFEKEKDTHLFERLVIIKDVFKSVQVLAWHPTSYKDSEYYYYLAVSSRDLHTNEPNELYLFDLRTKITQNSHQMMKHVTNSDMTLSGHTKTIAEISWSPHQENHLCSCSFDTKSILWSIDICDKSHRILSEFVARDRLFTAEWSTVDNDLILTSGLDSTIVAWRPSENIVDCAIEQL